MIYTNIEQLILPNLKVKQYTKLGDNFVKWVNENTLKLYTKRTKQEEEASNILHTLKVKFEPQCFFFDSISKKSYFLDFLLIDRGIALEIDGGYHLLNKEYDKERDKFFSSIGIKTIRVKNDKVSYLYIKNILDNTHPKKTKIDKNKIKDLNIINNLITRYNKKYNENISKLINK